MANAAYRSSSTAAAQTGATFSVNKPAGTTDGDVLTAFQATALGGGTAPATPTGWSLKDTQSFNSGSCTLQRFEKTASSEPSSWTFNNAGGGLGADSSVYVVCSSPGASTSEGSSKNFGSGTTADPGVYSCVVANELLLVAWCIPVNLADTITPDGSFTDLGTIGDSSIRLDVGYKTQAGSGNTANTSATLSGSLAWGSILAAIAPTPAATAPEGWETVAPERTWDTRLIPTPG